MSGGEITSGVSACGGDAAAYALGALEPSEAADFLWHLEACAVCRDELAAFQQIVDTLPMAAHQYRASRGLRRRVIADVRAQPRATRRPGRDLRFLWGRVAARPAVASGLATVAVAVILGGIALAPGRAHHASVVQAAVIGVPGSAHLEISDGRAELIVNHLPPPATGRIYEVWIRRGAHPPEPTRALFTVTTSGAADVGVPGDLNGVNTIMVTEEPAGGSLTPTHPPVIVARLTAE